jgi:sterol desaturase/sphingolipid hydroxylase (fatty acid hydroxylase superfamily)
VPDDLVRREAALYLWLYLAVLALLAAWEGVAACRALEAPLRRRWLGNGFLAVSNAVLVRALFPMLGVAWAVAVAERGLGLFHRLAAPAWLAAPAAFLALDAARYATHRLLHRAPWLWRLHRTHHSDPDYDFTTSFRFHPFEAVLDAGVELALVAALGAAPGAVLVYVLAVAVSTPFQHANVLIGPRWERVLGGLLVTPGLHRVHHSALASEQASNFGSVLSIWDRWLDTRIAAPALGARNMRVGLAGFRAPRHLSPLWMLANPFLAPDDAPRAARTATAPRRPSAPSGTA